MRTVARPLVTKAEISRISEALISLGFSPGSLMYNACIYRLTGQTFSNIATKDHLLARANLTHEQIRKLFLTAMREVAKLDGFEMYRQKWSYRDAYTKAVKHAHRKKTQKSAGESKISRRDLD